MFLTLKKKYLRKRKDLKSTSKSGNAADVMLKTEKGLDSYKFLSWLDGFIQSRQGRSNLPQIQLPHSIDSLNQFPDRESYERGEQTLESENGGQDFAKSEENECKKGYGQQKT